MAQRQRQLRKTLPKNILGDSDSENELVRSLEPPLKQAKLEVTKNDSLMVAPRGFPNAPNVFSDSCLLVSIAIGTLYHEAQAETDTKKRRALERSVTDINAKDKNNISRRRLQIG